MSRTAVALAALAAILAVVLASCGGGGATATPSPATSTPAPTRPPVATAAPTSTSAPARTAAPAGTATPAPGSTVAPAPPATTAPAATPTPAPTPRPAASPTVAAASAKRGGTLQLPCLPVQPYGYDTYEAGGVGSAGHEVWQPLFSNLIWPDPYAEGHPLAGDAADRWQISPDGKVMTFFLRPGIKFQDGTPLTSADVVYAVERAWKPRSPTMTYFRAKMQAVQKVEAVDPLTVRITLSAPSNALLQTLGMNQFTMYPSSLPFPEKDAEFKKQPIGSGPFKLKSLTPQTKFEYVRNEAYWKTGLPYLDGINITPMTSDISIAAFRAGRLDAGLTNQANELTPTLVKALQQQQGFITYQIGSGPALLAINQRDPFKNPKAREALSLALDRQLVLKVWKEDVGTAYASPLLAPELGGKWGISTEVMKTRPGFRADKTADAARAKQLLKEAGIEPGSFTITIRSSPSQPGFGAGVESGVRELGFKTNLIDANTVENTDAVRRGDFDIQPTTSSITFDDPLDYIASYVVTGGGTNWGKWSNARVDSLMEEQDRTADEAKRKQLLIDLQNVMLDDNYGGFMIVLQRQAFLGYMPWLKNYPPKLPFNHSARYRWEQVWLDRG